MSKYKSSPIFVMTLSTWSQYPLTWAFSVGEQAARVHSDTKRPRRTWATVGGHWRLRSEGATEVRKHADNNALRTGLGEGGGGGVMK